MRVSPPHFVFLSLLCLVTAGCYSARQKAEKTLKTIDPEKIRKEAGVFNKDLFASGEPISRGLKPSEYPPTFRAFAPLQVNAYRDGFSLKLEQSGGMEAGIYIVPAQMDVEPQSRGRAHFERIADGIYWYSFRE